MHHMLMPHSFWAYALVAVDVLILVWVLFLGLKYTFKPGEESPDHIKRRILEDAPDPQPEPSDASPPVVADNPWSRPYPPGNR